MSDQTITSLIEKLEGADVGSRELDREVWLACRQPEKWGGPINPPGKGVWEGPHVSYSLDAALALAERVLDQRGPININICLAGSAQVVIDSVGPCDLVMAQVVARTPALALCAAILRAQSEARV